MKAGDLNLSLSLDNIGMVIQNRMLALKRILLPRAKLPLPLAVDSFNNGLAQTEKCDCDKEQESVPSGEKGLGFSVRVTRE